MTCNPFPPNEKAALNILCLFLAQSGRPHEDLGFETQDEAFGEIGEIFRLSKNSVKLERDRYDHFTDSDRVGWAEDALPARLQPVFDQYATLARNELLEISKKILSWDWGGQMPTQQKNSEFFDRIVGEADAPTQVRVPTNGINVEFSNTGKRSNGWFILSVEQIITVLDDLIERHGAIVAEVGTEASYQESVWRRLFEEHLSNDVARTMGKVQTLPLFEVLSKIVHFAETSSKRVEKSLNLNLAALNKARAALHAYSANAQANEPMPKEYATRTGGENIIFYGAPGTGKSHRVDAMISVSGTHPIRTVFHPDLQNSDFFGCLKPRMDGDKVRYDFAPGPFMEALAAAYLSPAQPVYLVIEELNRAAAAAVFGDLFLLLDRDDNGASEYSVSFPSPESRMWLEAETKREHSSIKLPSNLSIYATMNSADQGVYPIDTAFRRRWRQEYLPLNYSAGPDGEVAYADESNTLQSMEWKAFVEVLNRFLVGNHSLSVAEDRLLGQWFVKKNELGGGNIPEKVLLYLWDDLLRHEGREQIFDTTTIPTYGALDKAAKEKKRFLSSAFLRALSATSNQASEGSGTNNAS